MVFRHKQLIAQEIIINCTKMEGKLRTINSPYLFRLQISSSSEINSKMINDQNHPQLY